MNVREYFYVVAEEEKEEVVRDSGQRGVFQANEPNEAMVIERQLDLWYLYSYITFPAILIS